jgi:hypothetical protein
MRKWWHLLIDFSNLRNSAMMRGGGRKDCSAVCPNFVEGEREGLTEDGGGDANG